MAEGITRRTFLGAITSTAALGTVPAPRALGTVPKPGEGVRLGFDNFSIRACDWDAAAILDYAARQGVDTVFFSDLEILGSHEEAALARIRGRAEALGLQLHVGTGSVCPTSASFDPRYGTAVQRLLLTLRIARLLGSPVARCYLGTAQDRRGDGGIHRHMEAMVKVLRDCQGAAEDAEVRIAVENHAGDMQARELVELIEAAGKGFVGATLDSGNAVWTLEDPMENLETLGRYALTTGIRDCVVWETPEGAAVQWTAMGEGQIDWPRYLARFAELCPGVPIQLEIISGFNREFPWRNPDFWVAYDRVPARTFAGFLELARRGRPKEPAVFPEGPSRREAEARYQLAELEKSIRYCRETLGLGLRSRKREDGSGA